MTPTVTQEVMIATKDDISRLETSIKELTVAVKAVVLIEERQTVQGKRIGDLESLAAVHEAAHLQLEKRVDSWINRTLGAWFVFTLLATVFAYVFKH